jgi:hypothetical protein
LPLSPQEIKAPFLLRPLSNTLEIPVFRFTYTLEFNRLFHNNGDGTFTDVTEKAGVGAEGKFGIQGQNRAATAAEFYSALDNCGYPIVPALSL